MKLYSWTTEEGLTDAYHSGGTAQAIAETEAEARELIRELGVFLRSAGGATKSVREDACAGPASLAIPVESGFEVTTRAWVFPDAGCC